MTPGKYFTIFLLILGACGCQKTSPGLEATVSENDSPGFMKYRIASGGHYCDNNILKAVELKALNFIVQFDSTAVYNTHVEANQADINKLYGFSEGDDHHLNSARIGWAWYNDSLRLYAYAYSDGTRKYEEITPVDLKTRINCGIALKGNMYVFTVNGIERELKRAMKDSIVKGYQLYPYFGGNETAPHDIHIQIREIN